MITNLQNYKDSLKIICNANNTIQKQVEALWKFAKNKGLDNRCIDITDMSSIINWLSMPCTVQIGHSEEDYLRGILFPIVHEIETIKKVSIDNINYIKITLHDSKNNNLYITLPADIIGTEFKNLELNVEYSLSDISGRLDLCNK